MRKGTEYVWAIGLSITAVALLVLVTMLLALSCARDRNERSLDALVQLAESKGATTNEGPGAGQKVSLDSVYYGCLTTHAARLYVQLTSELPVSPEDLVPFLFVKPDIEIDEWKLTDDRLEITARLQRGDGTSRLATSTVFKPGTRAHDDAVQRMRDSRIAMLEADLREGRDPSYTGDDIASGRWSDSYWDNRWAYSDGPDDFKQLVWSIHLAKLLFTGAKMYQLSYGAYPASPSELLDFLGEVNPEAWVAPAAGSSIRLVSTYDGSNPAYIPSPDLRTCEVIVPLYGAGRETRGYPDGPKMDAASGYYPGDCIRYTTGMMVVFP